MPSRILIIDTVPANRNVLKAKMIAGGFDVESCKSLTEAEDSISAHTPDLIMINLSDQSEDRHAFCRGLRDTPLTAGIAQIAIGIADTARARFAALDAGADDVLPIPVHDTLLLARVRSLLRLHPASAEMAWTDGVRQALGFEDRHASFHAAPRIALISRDLQPICAMSANLRQALRQDVRKLALSDKMDRIPITPVPDLFVIAAGANDPAFGEVLAAVADLRMRADTGLSAQMVVAEMNRPELAAAFLDLGADDVVTPHCDLRELALRAQALLRRRALCLQVAAGPDGNALQPSASFAAMPRFRVG